MRANSTAKTPEEYFNQIPEPKKTELLKLHQLIIKNAPNLKPFMQSGMVGYGKYRYKSKSGSEGDWFTVGLSERKTGISVYICVSDEKGCIAEQAQSKIGKAIVGQSCIRFKKIEDINLKELESLIKRASKMTPFNKCD